MKAQKYYADQWKTIEANYKKGQYKSNLPIILEIQNTAIKEDNTIELIKSLKSEFSILNTTDNDEKNNSASRFFKKVQSYKNQLKDNNSLVYQVLANTFVQDYYNINRWKVNSMTNINSQDLSTIETWSKLDFKNYLNLGFSELEKKNLQLEKIEFEPYKSIFSQTENLNYFPTIADYNSLLQIQFLKNESYFTKNEIKENQKKISDIENQLISKNSGNSKLYFEKLKLGDQCQFSNCKNLQEQLISLYHSNTEGDYKVIIAQDIISELQSKKKFTEALSWIEKVKNTYPKSAFINDIINIENQIIQPQLSLKYETTTPANQPIPLVASYKNASSLQLKIYEVKDDYQGYLKYIYQRWDSNNFNNLKKSLLKTTKYDLPKVTDYSTKSTTLEISPLTSGLYVAEYFVNGTRAGDYYFIVSNSRIIYQNINTKKASDNQLKLVGRNSGENISNAGLEVYQWVENKNINKTISQTNTQATFKLPESKNDDYYRRYLIKSTKTNDFNLLEARGNSYYDEPDVATQNLVQIFLDRAIYRPGQTLYFKAIATSLNQKTEKVVPGKKLSVTLKDVNNQEVSKQEFTTNSFGSINGSFQLPNGKLNGEFKLEISSINNDDFFNVKDFEVEEYKRPKFEVTFEPVKEEYQYGKTIELKGKAMMFSGVPLSYAKVQYEIKKHNIRWRYFWWYPKNDDNENSILGEVTTNEKGEFTINLDLKKDETLDGIQVDNYEINASVTDINGETQTGETNLTVSSVSHYLALSEVKDSYFTGEKLSAKVEAKNYNNQIIKKSFTAKLSKLETPNRVIRNNFKNDIQDLPQLSEKDFIEKFPYDYYSENEKNEKIESVIFDKNFLPTEQNTYELSPSLKPGKYKLEVYNIEGKDSIKTGKIFEVYNPTKLENLKPFLKVISDKNEYNRNEKAKFYIYSAALSSKDALLNIFIQNGNGTTTYEQKPIKNGILIYELALPKNIEINKLNIQFQLVAYNDVQTKTETINIVSEKKPLHIETTVFRDKIKPGQKEKWSIKVLGNENEKILAEVLANMYDKSLDQFAANTYSWTNLFRTPYSINGYTIRESLNQQSFSKNYKYLDTKTVYPPYFNWFDGGIVQKLRRKKSEMLYSEAAPAPAPAEMRTTDTTITDQKIGEVIITGAMGLKKKSNSSEKEDDADTSEKDMGNIPIRQNLNETAFFYPNLLTDKDGNVSFEFTSPEALTQWKLMFLAHTQDARGAVLEKSVVTQKEFSVTPNYPRFLREGDELVFKTKLNNLSEKELSGTAQLQILDAFTNKDISSLFSLKDVQKSFSVKAGESTTAHWILKTPKGIEAIIIKILAKAGDFSDGEQTAIAILPNRMLVTDAVPIFVKEGQTKTFSLDQLKNADSKSIVNVSTSLELTTNPIWEVIFALPSLKNDTHLSADVTFNKWYADVLASEIFKANPKIKSIFDDYQAKGLLKSNLELNQELKQVLLDETPWTQEAKNEEEQMRKIARLFDANTMRNSISEDWTELQKLQNPDGGFSWLQGYPSSYSTSLYILKNLGKINSWLKGNLTDYQSTDQKLMTENLIKYVDKELNRYFDVKKENAWSDASLDFLDTRNYWEKDYPLSGNGKILKNLVITKAKSAKFTEFTFFGLHRAALLFNDYGLKETSKKLMTYLKETSVESENQGAYWKSNLNNWGWYNSKLINHAGAIEAFEKLTNDKNFTEELKIWLVTQKEVSHWDSSRGTAEVIYTIVNSGKSWTSNTADETKISWGNTSAPSPLEKAGARTSGYYKNTVVSDVINKNLSTVTIQKPSPGIVQGGLYWQYYEDLNKIKSSESYLSITKELYKKVKTENGEELQKITEKSPLKVGDKVTVRMILNTNRPIQFVHLKDMRAAGFEPVDVLSGYQWKNNLGYYQSTKDASTNFYIESMNKGKYVFEYDYICNAAGSFSSGITQLQNYYAPQMNAHTEGASVNISE